MSLILRALSHRSLQTALLLRHISTTKLPCARAQPKSEGASVAKSEPRGDVGEAKPMGERVKETAKTTSYLGVIVAGIGVTAVMFYTIFSELLSSNSPQAIYGKALEKCQEHPRVQDSLGQPIKGYGEESSRRRRNHVAHQIYMRNNRKCMRLSFHIQGIRNKATVHCEMREVGGGFMHFTSVAPP